MLVSGGFVDGGGVGRDLRIHLRLFIVASAVWRGVVVKGTVLLPGAGITYEWDTRPLCSLSEYVPRLHLLLITVSGRCQYPLQPLVMKIISFLLNVHRCGSNPTGCIKRRQ